MNKYTYQIPKFLYDKRIHGYVIDLISKGVKTYQELYDTEKDNIVVLIIEVLGNDSYELITGSDNFDKTLNFFSSFLKSANSSDAYDLLTQMRKNAQEQYSYDIEQLFIEILEGQTNSRRLEAGLSPYTNKQTGELEWRKSA